MARKKNITLTPEEKIEQAIENLKFCINDLTTAISEKVIYDIIQKNLMSHPQAQPAPAQPQKKRTYRKRTINWAEKSDFALYSALNSRRKTGKEIEPELDAELQKRFPTYDPQTHIVARRSTRITDWENVTNQQLRTALNNRRTNGVPIEPALMSELQKRFPNFDPVTLTFTRKKTDWAAKSKKALQAAITYRTSHGLEIPAEITAALAECDDTKKPSKKTDWSQTPAVNLRAAYYHRKKHNLPIEPELNAALLAAFPGYDATTQKFTGKRTHKTVPATANQPIKKTTEQVIAQTIPETKSQKPNEISVYIEYVKSDLHGAYNNVYLNGKRILSNHYNTNVKLLFDGTLLAIHGIITDNRNFPKKPIWQIYDTNLKPRIALQKQKFSGYNIHATNISERDDALYLNLSNRCTAIIKRDRTIKEAGQKRFIITQQKTK